MLTAKQTINVEIFFNTTFILTKMQLDYINNHITELVKDCITKGECVKLDLKSGLDQDDNCIVSDYAYIFEFIAEVEGEYDRVNNFMIWETKNKVEEIDSNLLANKFKRFLPIANFGSNIEHLNVKILPVINEPPNSL